MKYLNFTAEFITEKDGGYMAFVKELSEAISYGDTLEEAQENIKDAINLVLESKRENHTEDGESVNKQLHQPQ